MSFFRFRRLSCRLLPLLLLACAPGPEGVVIGEDFLQIRLQVTGGIAAADYAVLLDGQTGLLLGESCTSLCGFEVGETLQTLVPAQVAYLANLFQEAGVGALDDEDFGVECCDQFHYAVQYVDRGGEHRFQGSSEALPAALRQAVATLQGMATGTLPVVVDFQTTPDVWPREPFQLGTTEIHGDLLDVSVSYGGGCRVHDLKAVAWGGWMESHPVQVRVFLSHRSFNDPCDAWITRELRFDLGPVKWAYQTAYGVAEPGTTTVVLLLEDPLLMSPLGARPLSYVF